MVRNILFGEQVNRPKTPDYVRAFVKVWDEFHSRGPKNSLWCCAIGSALLKDLLAEENKARLGDVAQTRERFIQIPTRTLEEMSRRQNLGQEELHQRLSQEVSQLKQALLQQRQDLLTQVKVILNN